MAKRFADEFNSKLMSFVLLACAFGLLYNISFIGYESFSTGRLAVVLLLLLALPRLSVFEGFPLVGILLLVPLPYVFVLSLFQGDMGGASRFFHLGLYSVVGGFLFSSLAKSPKEVLLVFLLAITLQSVIVLFSFFSQDYRAWFDSTVVAGANFGADYLYRAPGFSGSGGAALSVIQSMGVFCGLSLLYTKYRLCYGGLCNLFIAFCIILCAISCVFVARTGLVLSFLFVAIFAIGRINFTAWKLAFLVFAGFGVISGIGLLEEAMPAGFSVEFFVDWAFGFLSGEFKIHDELYSMPVPPIGIETIHGTGWVSLRNGENPSGHDSGFIQTYYAIGLPLTVYFYAAYLYLLCRVLQWIGQFRGSVIAFIFLLIEIKEPFVFKYSLPLVLLCIYYAECRNALMRK